MSEIQEPAVLSSE